MSEQDGIAGRIAGELGVAETQVVAAVALLDEGATVPFIARYRKERTGGLDDIRLRRLEERLAYLRELEARRQTVLESIGGQGRLTPELEARIRAADTKAGLEDLYLPFKPKRRTRAQIAREAGLEPLALALLETPELDPEEEAARRLNPDAGFGDTRTVLDGARQILMERFSEDAELSGRLRDHLWRHGVLRSSLVAGREHDAAKFADYFDYAEPIREIPSHRALALFRGRAEGVLNLELLVDPDGAGEAPCEQMVARRFGIGEQGRAADSWLLGCASWAWRVKIFTRLDLELKMRLREAAFISIVPL